MRVAIIGAGLAGLHLARRLSDDHDVLIFEKSRRPGGRMATRIVEGYAFDHGAQFFSARSESFQTFLAPLIETGIVAPWRARFVEFSGNSVSSTRQWGDTYPHFVSVPTMNRLGAYLAESVTIRYGSRVMRLAPTAGGWTLEVQGEPPAGPFDWVVTTAPAPQSSALLPDNAGLLPAEAESRMRGCFALMLGFDTPIETDFDAALVREADISWISVNSSKPGRTTTPTCWLIHSTNKWADAHMEDALNDVTTHLLSEVSRVTDSDTSRATHVDIHRWRYANLDRQNHQSFAIDYDRRLAACGDWFIRGRVEAAFTSADALATAWLDSAPRR